jgi:hypothetical protein
MRCKINRGYLTILGTYIPEERHDRAMIAMRNYEIFMIKLTKMAAF